MRVVRVSSLPSSLCALLLLSSRVAAEFFPDFGFYPEDARSCLDDAGKSSKCTGDTVAALNSCLCSNHGNFVTDATSCIAKSDKKELEQVYNIMSDACAHSSTPLSVPKNKFMNPDLAKTTTSSLSATDTTTSSKPTATTATTTSSSSSATTTTSSSPTTTQSSDNQGKNNNNNKGEGISSTAKTGIIAGACVAGAAIVAAIVFFVLRYRRARHAMVKDENHPMLSPPNMGMAGLGGRASYQRTEYSGDGNESKWRHHSSADWTAAATATGHPSWLSSEQQQQQRQASSGAGWKSPTPSQAWGYSPNAPYPAHTSPTVPPQAVFELPGQDAERPAAKPNPANAQQQQPRKSSSSPQKHWAPYRPPSS